MRKLSIVVMALSTILILATTIGWATNRSRASYLIYDARWHYGGVNIDSTGVSLGFVRYFVARENTGWEWGHEPENIRPSQAKPLGFYAADSGSEYPSYRVWYITFPYWFVYAAELSVGLLAYWRFRRLKVLPGHCVQCGYDLRASADRCPECGRAIVASVE